MAGLPVVASLGGMAEIALIVNPLATAVDEHRMAAVEAVLGRLGNVTTMLTQGRGHATELAREASGADAIFVLSGAADSTRLRTGSARTRR